MNRFMLYAAVLWLAVRQRWYESKWNPWGMGSRAAQHRAGQAVLAAVNRFMLYAAVLCLAVRQRWYESKWNPWGMGSRAAQHRAGQAVLDALEKQGPAFIRAATGTDPSPPNPPVQ